MNTKIKNPQKIHYLDEIDSTNSWALREIGNGAQAGEVFTTDFQTHGRGRLDRNWEAQKGKNILLSFIDTIPEKKEETPSLTLLAGVAVRDAITSLLPDLNIKLKWPNDLLINYKKVAGILCEAHPQKPFVVIGIGLNVLMEAKDFSPEIAHTATSLKIEAKLLPKKEELITAILDSYQKARDIYNTQGLSSIINEWKKHTMMIGKKVRVVDGTLSYEAVVKDLDEQGFLLVQKDNKIIRIIAGDIYASSH